MSNRCKNYWWAILYSFFRLSRQSYTLSTSEFGAVTSRVLKATRVASILGSAALDHRRLRLSHKLLISFRSSLAFCSRLYWTSYSGLLSTFVLACHFLLTGCFGILCMFWKYSFVYYMCFKDKLLLSTFRPSEVPLGTNLLPSLPTVPREWSLFPQVQLPPKSPSGRLSGPPLNYG